MSIVANFQANGIVPSTVGGTGTSVKYFPRPLGPSIGVAPTTPSSTNANGALLVPGNNSLNGQHMAVNVRGSVYTDPTIACPTVTVAVYAVTNYNSLGIIPGSNPVYTAIASTGGLTTSSLNYNDEPFAFTLNISADTASGVLQGIQAVLYNNVLVASSPKVLGSTLTGINMGYPIPFGLVIGVTFSVSGANNLATLTEFNIDA
jgi:hypothetical protein